MKPAKELCARYAAVTAQSHTILNNVANEKDMSWAFCRDEPGRLNNLHKDASGCLTPRATSSSSSSSTSSSVPPPPSSSTPSSSPLYPPHRDMHGVKGGHKRWGE
eukprot:2151204-Pyramimonas_sp.AAC.2